MANTIAGVNMIIGAHVSTSGGLSKSIDRAQAIGAEGIQIFASSPRAWRFNFPKEEEVILFKEKSLVSINLPNVRKSKNITESHNC